MAMMMLFGSHNRAVVETKAGLLGRTMEEKKPQKLPINISEVSKDSLLSRWYGGKNL